MKQRLLFIILSLLALVSVGCKYPTLEEAIEVKSKSPIKILLNDKENNVVVFNNAGQYVFNTYQRNKQKYSYAKTNEVGVYVNYTIEHPILVINSFDDDEIGNIIWGIIGSNKKAEMVDITFTKREISDIEIKMNLPVKNNVFVGYPPVQFFDKEIPAEWRIQVKAYDEDGNLIAEKII